FPSLYKAVVEIFQWFGPFGEHAVNASWIAVQELEKLGLRDDVDLHVYEVPVEYQTVQRLIPALWKKHSPQLVVHVGVSGMATTVTLEKCGHNVGYKGLDNCRFCPGSQCCVEGGPECIDSIIDMDAVCRRVSALGLDVTVTISKDAGRWGLSPGHRAPGGASAWEAPQRFSACVPVFNLALGTSRGAHSWLGIPSQPLPARRVGYSFPYPTRIPLSTLKTFPVLGFQPLSQIPLQLSW
uniref:Pyroglutamyl-peptidase I n=1 Tax=Taeniopygia guttata TaxID=59729 RepID=H0YRZ3_TAEGU